MDKIYYEHNDFHNNPYVAGPVTADEMRNILPEDVDLEEFLAGEECYDDLGDRWIRVTVEMMRARIAKDQETLRRMEAGESTTAGR
jgi:hypothetical protein